MITFVASYEELVIVGYLKGLAIPPNHATIQIPHSCTEELDCFLAVWRNHKPSNVTTTFYPLSPRKLQRITVNLLHIDRGDLPSGTESNC